RGNATQAAAVALVNSILASPKGYPVSGNEVVLRKSFVDLATYARSLEQQIAALTGASGAPVASGSKTAAKPARSQAELEAAGDEIRRAAQSGIKKQTTFTHVRCSTWWKPSCKTGSVKWSYDPICPDPEVFGALMGLGDPPTFKMKKFSTDEFQRLVGPIEGSVKRASPGPLAVYGHSQNHGRSPACGRYDTLYITGTRLRCAGRTRASSSSATRMASGNPPSVNGGDIYGILIL
ncbi:hypothetical protein BD413DRAFT_640086, partial [Trametes elegans]